MTIAKAVANMTTFYQPIIVPAAATEFGMERLTDVIQRNLNASAAGIRDKVESALSTFTQTAPANDDITLVIAKRV